MAASNTSPRRPNPSAAASPLRLSRSRRTVALLAMSLMTVAGCGGGSDSADKTYDTRKIGDSSSDAAVKALIDFYVKDGTFSKEQATCIADSLKGVIDLNAYVEFADDPSSGIPVLSAEQAKAQGDAVSSCVEKFPASSVPNRPAPAPGGSSEANTTPPSVLTPEPPTPEQTVVSQTSVPEEAEDGGEPAETEPASPTTEPESTAPTQP